mgnify:CR=1 FL=1
MNHLYYIVLLIILESISIGLLKYSSKNNNNYYILSGLLYLLIVYLLYQLFKIEKVVTSFALWNIGAILSAYIISTFIFKEGLDYYEMMGIILLLVSIVLLQHKYFKLPTI